MNRHLSIITLIAIATASHAFCQAETITLTPATVSQYIFRGERLSGVAFQPKIELAADDLTLGIWSSMPMTGGRKGVSDPEYDFYAFYSYKFNDKLAVITGGTIYHVPQAVETEARKTTVEPQIGLVYTIAGVTLTPKLYYDLDKDASTYEMNASYALPYKLVGNEITLGLTAGTFLAKDVAHINTGGRKTKNWGDYYQIGVSAPIKVDDKSRFILGLAVAGGHSNYYKLGTDKKVENIHADNHVLGSAAYIYTF